MPNWKRSSLRVRITLAASTFAALVGIIMSALVLVTMHNMDVSSGREQTTETIDRMVFHVQKDVFPRPLSKSGDVQIQVLNARGQVVAATRKLEGKPPMATFRATGDQMRVSRTLCPPAGLNGCMTVVAYKVVPDGTWTIYAAIPVVPWYVNATLAIFLAVVTLLFIAMTGMWVWRAVGETLAPMDAIRTKMDEIKATDLDQRVPVPNNQNEIRMLAESVNTTLDRLEAAYDQLRRFTADASHEVRSPLTAIRTQMEEALMYPDETDWPQVGEAVLAAAERLEALMTDLLVLARLDAGVSLKGGIPTDLGQMVEDQLNQRTSPVKVTTNLPEGVFTSCERLRITRLLDNLMDNAERHATSQITVTVRAEQRWAVLEVTDDGTGIPADAHDMVFRRFTRLDTARNRDAGGSGLGLAIARQIAEVHGGTLTIEDSERGARFVLRLPRYDPSHPARSHDNEHHR